jgi:hypothetical protein
VTPAASVFSPSPSLNQTLVLILHTCSLEEVSNEDQRHLPLRLQRPLARAVPGPHQRSLAAFFSHFSAFSVAYFSPVPPTPLPPTPHQPRNWATTPPPSPSPTTCPSSCSSLTSSSANRVSAHPQQQAPPPAAPLRHCFCRAGPGVVTEATCIGVPVVVEFNESTLAQEVRCELARLPPVTRAWPAGRCCDVGAEGGCRHAVDQLQRSAPPPLPASISKVEVVTRCRLQCAWTAFATRWTRLE